MKSARPYYYLYMAMQIIPTILSPFLASIVMALYILTPGYWRNMKAVADLYAARKWREKQSREWDYCNSKH